MSDKTPEKHRPGSLVKGSPTLAQSSRETSASPAPVKQSRARGNEGFKRRTPKSSPEGKAGISAKGESPALSSAGGLGAGVYSQNPFGTVCSFRALLTSRRTSYNMEHDIDTV